MGKVILEIGGPNLRPEMAQTGESPHRLLFFDLLTSSLHSVLRLAAAKLPCTTEFIDRNSPARLGFDNVAPEPARKPVLTRAAVSAAQSVAATPVEAPAPTL